MWWQLKSRKQHKEQWRDESCRHNRKILKPQNVKKKDIKITYKISLAFSHLSLSGVLAILFFLFQWWNLILKTNIKVKPKTCKLFFFISCQKYFNLVLCICIIIMGVYFSLSEKIIRNSFDSNQELMQRELSSGQ